MAASDRRSNGYEPKLIAALAAGHRHVDAAREAGISERTVRRRLEDPDFRRAVAEFRALAMDRSAGILAQASAAAAVALTRLVINGTAWQQIHAAKAILEHAARYHEAGELRTRVDELEGKVDAQVERSAEMTRALLDNPDLVAALPYLQTLPPGADLVAYDADADATGPRPVWPTDAPMPEPER